MEDKKSFPNGIDERENIIYNSAISCEAEITDENDLSESGELVEAPQDTIVQMDRRARRGT